MVLSLQFLMKKAGFDVRVARDGEEALQAVEERAPDMVLLDVMIPKRDGYDVCQTIRSNPEWSNIHIMYRYSIHLTLPPLPLDIPGRFGRSGAVHAARCRP